MSIRIRSDVVSMKGIDAAKFTSETNKGVGKLKAVKAFFRGVSVARDVVKTFTENHSSKLAETLEDGLIELDKRLVARANKEHNEALRESRVAENMGDIVENGRRDMQIYDYICMVYTRAGREEDLAEFSDFSSDEVFCALVDSGLFNDKELRMIDRTGTDLEGSPHW